MTPPKKPKKRKASIEINAQEASIAEARKRVDSSYCHAGLLDRMPDEGLLDKGQEEEEE